MARPLRIEFAGALYHVTARGDRREDIFADDQDREALLAVLSQVCRRYAVTCHAYCLMGNHYHLVLETAEPNLCRALRQLNGVYTQRFTADTTTSDMSSKDATRPFWSIGMRTTWKWCVM